MKADCRFISTGDQAECVRNRRQSLIKVKEILGGVELVETRIFEKTDGLTEKQFHYCPGCTHGIIHRLVAEVLEELDVLGETIGIAPVGCSVLAYDYFNCDMQEAAHGRAPALPPALSGYARIILFSRIRETVIWQPLEQLKLFMWLTGQKKLPRSSSIMPSTV
jgi:hypothetical protein